MATDETFPVLIHEFSLRFPKDKIEAWCEAFGKRRSEGREVPLEGKSGKLRGLMSREEMLGGYPAGALGDLARVREAIRVARNRDSRLIDWANETSHQNKP
jgi:hypothetical protein